MSIFDTLRTDSEGALKNKGEYRREISKPHFKKSPSVSRLKSTLTATMHRVPNDKVPLSPSLTQKTQKRRKKRKTRRIDQIQSLYSEPSFDNVLKNGSSNEKYAALSTYSTLINSSINLAEKRALARDELKDIVSTRAKESQGAHGYATHSLVQENLQQYESRMERVRELARKNATETIRQRANEVLKESNKEMDSLKGLYSELMDTMLQSQKEDRDREQKVFLHSLQTKTDNFINSQRLQMMKNSEVAAERKAREEESMKLWKPFLAKEKELEEQRKATVARVFDEVTLSVLDQYGSVVLQRILDLFDGYAAANGDALLGLPNDTDVKQQIESEFFSTLGPVLEHEFGGKLVVEDRFNVLKEADKKRVRHEVYSLQIADARDKCVNTLIDERGVRKDRIEQERMQMEELDAWSRQKEDDNRNAYMREADSMAENDEESRKREEHEKACESRERVAMFAEDRRRIEMLASQRALEAIEERSLWKLAKERREFMRMQEKRRGRELALMAAEDDRRRRIERQRKRRLIELRMKKESELNKLRKEMQSVEDERRRQLEAIEQKKKDEKHREIEMKFKAREKAEKRRRNEEKAYVERQRIEHEQHLYKTMEQGTHFIKHGMRGNPNTRYVWLSEGHDMLCWGKESDFKKNLAKSFLFVSEILNIVSGQTTEVFARNSGVRGREQQSFSVVTRERTLDLVADEPGIANEWVAMLNFLLEQRDMRRMTRTQSMTNVDEHLSNRALRSVKSKMRQSVNLSQGGSTNSLRKAYSVML
ncbi:hypothetical protein PCE1_003481 [Barthelona sp. PCE]